MKMSAWIRFCLIVLCLAMACSMFACKGPEEQTTEAPVVDTTEAPSDEPTTEKPTEKPTETTPIEVTTEEPVVTTEPTEVTTEPTEVTTEPTEVTTEPTEVTTEPTEVTTEAPATETTEVPATETTETTTTETEEVTNTYLEEETVVIGDIGYVEEAASPYACTIDSHGGALGQTFVYTADPLSHVVSGIKGWIAIRPGILKYVYAVVVDGVQGEWVDVTKEPIAYATGTVGYDRSDVITHIANNLPGFESGIAGTNCGFNFTHVLPDIGQYHGKDVSIVYYAVVYKVDGAGDRLLDPDGNGQEGAYIHMATLLDVMPEHYGVGGYRDNGDGTHSIKCEGCDVYYITEKCDPTFGSGATAKDTNTHTGMTCGLCGQTGVEGAHSAPANNVWDDEKGIYTTYYNDVVWDAEQGKYISVCIACGGQAGDAFGAVLSVELENLNIGQPAWATSQSNEETYTVITMGEHMSNGSPSGWKAAYFKVNPNGLRTGQYVALRYMIPEGSNATTLGFEFVNVNVDVPVIADGEWHIVIVELPGKDASYAIPAGDTRLNFNNARGWKQGDQICLDWLKTYDSIEALNLDLQIGQEDCACPAWAIEVVDYAGVESHSVRCTICGREDTAAHTPSSTRGVAVEGGYVKACTVCGGATAEPAMGNYVFDADALATLTPAGGNENKEITENGVKFSNPGNVDSFLSVFSGNNQTIGKYFFIKYRSENLTQPQFYMWRNGGVNANLTPSINNDGEWHIAVVECDATNVSQLRIDVERLAETTGIPSIEIAYLGYADNAITLAKAIKALDSGAVTACSCPAFLGACEYVDVYNHASVCQLCGKVTSLAHTTPKTATWNADTERYETTCTTCNGLAVNPFETTHFMDGTWSKNLGGSGTANSYVDGVLVMTPNGNTAWGGISWSNAGTVGRYYVLKYRVTELKNPAATASFGLRVTGNAKAITLNADGKWHILVVDLTTTGLTADANGYVTTADYWFCNYTDGNLVKYEVAIAGWANSLDRIPNLTDANTFCEHSVTKTAIIDENEHGVICAVCGTIISSEEHVWSSTDCTTVIPACSCGAEKEELGHIAGGTDGEICVACKTFLYANPSEYFVQFWGGNSKISNSTFTGKYAESGYPIYYSASGETRTQIVNTATTFRYAVIKYKALGGFAFQFFAKSDGGAINGGEGYCKGVDMVYNEWAYAIIDLNQMMPSGAPLDGGGNCNITGLWIDFEGTDGTVEFGYLAVAATLEDLVAGIKAIENDNVDADYCPHIEALHINPEYKDLYSHDATCSLCGVNVTVAHSGGASGVWNDTLGYYESANACTVCGQKYDFEAAYSEEAENGVVRGQGSAWGSSHVAKNGYVEYSKYNSTWGAGYNSFNKAGVTTGRYLAVRYRVEEGSGTKVIFDETIVMPVIADGDWHVALLDVGTDIFTLGAKKFMFTSNEGWDVGSKIWFDWFRTYDSLDRIPDFGDECAHGVGESVSVLTVIADGSGTEKYAECASCGEDMIRPISAVPNADYHTVEGGTLEPGKTIFGGWIGMTGGVKEVRLVITDKDDTTKVSTIVCEATVRTDIPPHIVANYGYQQGEDSKYCGYSFTIDDFTALALDSNPEETYDFSGKSVKIQIIVVSRADNTYSYVLYTRNVTVAAATEATE